MNRQTPVLMAGGKKSKLPYEYKLVVVCLLIIAVTFGVAFSFGVFFKPMLDEFGWTRAATSGPFSLSMILSGLASFIAGRVSDRFKSGTLLAVTFGGVMLGAGTILMSQTSNIAQLYLFYGALVGIGQGSVLIPLLALICKYFPRRRAFVVAIIVSGIGLGTAVVPVVTTRIIEALNWRTSLIITGGVALISVILLAQFLRKKPEIVSLTGCDAGVKSAAAPSKNISVKEIMRIKQFWLIGIAWFFYGFFLQVANVHIVPYAIGIGMSAMAAAGIFTIIGVISIFGRLGVGFVGDRSSKENMLIIGLFAIALVYFGLVASQTMLTLYLFAVVYGMFCGVGILVSPILAERFGLAALGTLSGAVALVNSLGGAAGPVIAGYIYDKNGTYNLVFIICGIVGIIAALFIGLLKRSHQAGKGG